jgi:signal transduction histidine kinase
MTLRLQTKLTISFLLLAAVVIGATSTLLYWRIQTRFHEEFSEDVVAAQKAVRQQMEREARVLRDRLKQLNNAPALRALAQDLRHGTYDQEGHAGIHRTQFQALQHSADLNTLQVRWEPQKTGKVRDVLATHHGGNPKLHGTTKRYANGPMTGTIIVSQPVGEESDALPVLMVGVRFSNGLVALGGRAIDHRFLLDLRDRVGRNVDLTLRNLDNAIVESTLPDTQQARLKYDYKTERVLHTNEGETTPALQLDVHAHRERLNERTQTLINIAMVVSAGAVVLALLLGIVVARRLTRPLHELVAATKQVADGDRQISLPKRSGDELGELMDAFVTMTEELQASENRLRNAERVAAWEEIAQELAHEIKNPLTPIQMSIETLRRSWQRKHAAFDEHFDEATQTILEEVERLKRIVSEFREFARMPEISSAPCDLNEIVQRCTQLFAESDRDVHVTHTLSPKVGTILADAEQLRQVIQNLIQNAIQACSSTPSQGSVLVTTRALNAHQVEIAVEDNGAGIAEEDLARVFSPHFTQKTDGTGLGLSISHRIVAAHGGRIGVSSKPGMGARFVVVLPRTK